MLTLDNDDVSTLKELKVALKDYPMDYPFYFSFSTEGLEGHNMIYSKGEILGLLTYDTEDEDQGLPFYWFVIEEGTKDSMLGRIHAHPRRFNLMKEALDNV